MKYRFYGDELQLVRYEIKYKEPWNTDGEPDTQTAADEVERDELLEEIVSTYLKKTMRG